MVDAGRRAVLVDPRAGEQIVDDRQIGDRVRRQAAARRAVDPLGEGDHLEIGGGRQPPVEGAQQRPAVVGVAAPRVLAVEDHGDDVVAGGRQRVDAGSQHRQPGVGGGLGVGLALEAEADGVAELAVAEEHGELAAVGLDSPRRVPHLGAADVVAPASRAGEHALVGRDPGQPVAGQHRDRRRRHRALGRPHAAGRGAEPAGMRRQRARDLGLGVGGVRERRRQRGGRPVEAGGVAVDEQRQDRVEVGVADQLDPTGGGGRGVGRHHRAQELVLLADHVLDGAPVEAGALLDEALHRHRLAGGQRDGAAPVLDREPGQARPHLQVAQVVGGERAAVAARLVQRAVARVGRDLVAPVGVEEGRDHLGALVVVEDGGVDPGQLERAVGGPVEVVLDLAEQARRQVEGRAGSRLGRDQHRHGDVVAQRVQADPGQAQAAPRPGARQAPVERLVLVPEQGDVRPRAHGERHRR
jgi:hypothetical protein